MFPASFQNRPIVAELNHSDFPVCLMYVKLTTKIVNLSFCSEVRSMWAAVRHPAADQGAEAGTGPSVDAGGAHQEMRRDDIIISFCEGTAPINGASRTFRRRR